MFSFVEASVNWSKRTLTAMPGGTAIVGFKRTKGGTAICQQIVQRMSRLIDGELSLEGTCEVL